MQAGGRLTFAGWEDKPLTARGEQQAQAVAQRLSTEKLTAVYASDLSRARNTAQQIAKQHNLEVRVDARLREVNYGAWEGLGLDEILAQWQDVWDARRRDLAGVAPPNGESYGDLWKRLYPCWNEILASHGAEERIAIVAHNGTLRVLISRLLGMPLVNLRSIHMSNCGISCFEIKAAHAEYWNDIIACFINETHHLKEI